MSRGQALAVRQTMVMVMPRQQRWPAFQTDKELLQLLLLRTPVMHQAMSEWTTTARTHRWSLVRSMHLLIRESQARAGQALVVQHPGPLPCQTTWTWVTARRMPPRQQLGLAPQVDQVPLLWSSKWPTMPRAPLWRRMRMSPCLGMQLVPTVAPWTYRMLQAQP